ncbi:MAG: hypothetical protein U0521_13175 [Anaerolineae bacterium]
MPLLYLTHMPLTYISGDPLLTQQPILAIGSNAAGRTETSPLAMALLTRYPAAFASYGKLCRQGRIAAGTMWVWRETKPALAFMVVRETPVGATRLRYVDGVVMALARDYARDNIRSIAIAPLGAAHEQAEIQAVFDRWLTKSSLPVIAYTDYLPGVAAEAD